jgi:hypothetical protein
MTCRSIRDREGRFEISVAVHDEQLFAAVDHEDADAVLRSAFLLALAVLMQSDPWPDEALRSMSDFMNDMRQSLLQ